MANDELKKKIAEILKKACEPSYYGEDSEHAPEVYYPTDEDAVDALIAAGIGDEKEAEHRAERAERALLLACANVVKDEKDDVDIELLARVVYDKYLKQAEKELAEERKDD